VNPGIHLLIWRIWSGMSAVVSFLPLMVQWAGGQFGVRFSSLVLITLAAAAIFFSVKLGSGGSKWKIGVVALGYAVATYASMGGAMSGFAALWFAVSPFALSRVLATASQESDHEENPSRPA
jgi:hypothetical protein